MKSSRNKTISVEKGSQDYLELFGKCLNEKKFDGSQTDCIVQGDSFEVLKKIPEKSVDLVFSDPPYNLTKDYGSCKFTKKDLEGYKEYTEEWISLVKPILKDTGSIYVCCDIFSSGIVQEVLSKYFKVRNRITFKRDKGRSCKNNYKSIMEDVWFCTVGNSYTFNSNSTKTLKRVIAPYRDSHGSAKDWFIESDSNCKFRETGCGNLIDDITIPFWSMSENTPHPTQKPEKLLARIILASSNVDDTVLDPFCGSGTTCVVSKKLQRHYIGIELEEEYCVVAQKRLDMADSDNTIQGYNGKHFLERNS